MKPLLLATSLLLANCLWLASTAAQEPAKEKLIFDFEDAADLKAWSNLVPDAKEKDKEPAVKIEFVAEKATSGKQSMKLTFAGGIFPTVATEQVAQDWLAYQTFQADVTVSRPCVVGFAIMQEKSERGGGWDALISRWTKTAFLKEGKNRVTASLPQPNNYALHAKWGKIVRFEIFMFKPRMGESIHVDNIRLSTAKLPPPKKTDFSVAGAGRDAISSCPIGLPATVPAARAADRHGPAPSCPRSRADESVPPSLRRESAFPSGPSAAPACV